MQKGLLNTLKNANAQQMKLLAVLVDPDKTNKVTLTALVKAANNLGVDFFFVGGSYLREDNTAEVIEQIKTLSDIPVLLFPGNPSQLCDKADAVLLLSLISGRNADLLIGRHVEAAPKLFRSGIEIIPTGYMLIDGGRATAVSYISNTQPIPADKPDIAAFTALAGVQLGLQTIYLDAGSGALYSIPAALIKQVKQLCNVPVIVGGGIRTAAQMKEAYDAGAEVVVVGNALEKDPQLLEVLTRVKNHYTY